MIITNPTKLLYRSLLLGALLLILPVINGCANAIIPNGVAQNSMHAEISPSDGLPGGGSFDATNAGAVDAGDGTIHVSADMLVNNVNYSISFVVPKQSTFPYSIDVHQNINSRLAYCNGATTCSSTSTAYIANPLQGSGIITITALQPDVTGSFEGTVVLSGSTSSDSVRTITNGQFDATY